MLLGILSDSHGHNERVRRAIALFDRLGCEGLVHCGDLEDADVLYEFVGRRLWFVGGNCDLDSLGLDQMAREHRFSYFADPPGVFSIAGKKIALLHGHEASPDGVVHRALDDCAYLFHGHTHVARDARIGRVRVINPGALHRAAMLTVATLDVAADRLQFWPISKQPGAPLPDQPIELPL